MPPSDSLAQLRDMALALGTAVGLARHDRWTRSALEAHQHARLQRLVQHALRRSPFYRELYGPGRMDHEVRLEALPPIDKRLVMDHFDRLVTDSRLKLANLQAHVEQLERDDLYLDEYRVLPTSGSTGRRGLFVYNRREWATLLAGGLRVAAHLGVRPRLTRRIRFSTVAAHDARHLSYRLAGSLGQGLSASQQLDATAPLPSLVAALNAFQPEVLVAYPSSAALLAAEQLAGRLRIQPRAVVTAAEVRTEDMARRMRAAWGPALFDVYALTEAFVGGETAFHEGIEVLEDLVILEVADERNQPVPDGTPGQKVLLTNLCNFTQPLIRYEVTDLLTMAEGPSASGRPFRRIRTIEGRSDDIIALPGAHGGEVPVHPLQFRGPLLTFGEVVQYQVVHDEDLVTLRLVLADEANPAATVSRVREAITGALRSLQVRVPAVDVQVVPEIEREVGQTGKLKLVRCNLKLKQRGQGA